MVQSEKRVFPTSSQKDLLKKAASLIVSSILLEKFSRSARLAKLFEKRNLPKKKAEEFAEKFNGRLYRRWKDCTR